MPSTACRGQRPGLGSGLLCAFMLLAALAMPSLTVAAPSEVFYITGSSFVWSLILGDTNAATAVETAVGNDVNAATGSSFPGVSFTASIPAADTRAMSITIATTDGSDITTAMHDAIFAAPLTSLDTALQGFASSIPALQGYESILPTSARFYNPLPLRSDGSPEDPVANVTPVASYTSYNVVFLSGTYAKWQQATSSAVGSTALRAELQGMLDNILSRDLVTATSTVTSMVPTAAGDLESMSGGASGLMAFFSVRQDQLAESSRPYSADEICSVIFSSDPSAQGVTDLDGVTVISCRVDADFGLKLTGPGKGMIAMAAVAGAIMLAAFIVTIILICCCSRWRGDAKPSDASSTQEGEAVAGNPHEPKDEDKNEPV